MPQLAASLSVLVQVPLHSLLQIPQLLGSVCRLAQVEPQTTVGGWQVITVWHIPPTQLWPLEQGMAQPPQLLSSMSGFTQLQLGAQAISPIGQATVHGPLSGIPLSGIPL